MRDGGARLTVGATGRSGRPADLARAVLVCEATADSAASARTTAAGLADGVIATIRGTGVPESDLRTAGLDVSPNWEHDGTRAVRNGFTVTNRIGVTIRDLAAVGRVLDAGLESGATGLDEVLFVLADESGPAEEARRAAVADARRRAETIADAAGLRLGTLVSISEGVPPGPAPFPGARMMAMAADAAPTPVMPGLVEVTVSVTAEWELLGE